MVVDSVRTPRWLRAEGASVFLISVLLYAQHGGSWFLFVLLFLLPDLSLAGYLRGARLGAVVYNVFHTYTVPLLVGAAAAALEHSLLFSLALVWSAHIGLDRALGYGLKLATGFRDTHLGRIGRSAGVPPEEVAADTRG